MPLPTGIVTSELNYGAAVTFTGAPIQMRITVIPSQHIVWAATGQPLVAFSESTTTDTSGSITLPVVDQPGFLDAAGQPITMWSYSVTLTYQLEQRVTSVTKVVQPVTGQASVDLDLLPFGPAAAPILGVVPAVTSVNGETGVVTVPGSVEVHVPPPNGTDDTAAIQSAIDGSPVGSTVRFAAGTYLITGTIRLLPSRAYVGSGWALGGGSTIKQKDGANITGPSTLTGLLVANAWYVSSTSCDNPIHIDNLAVNGNKANNPSSTACGIVLMNYWSTISRCYISHTPLHGVHLTDLGRNGTTQISNSASENRLIDNKIDAPAGHGISQVCLNTISNQDGYCHHNLISLTGLDGINFQRGSGWDLRRNHLYGISGSGITLSNCFATTLEANEIEDFGGTSAAGVYYVGIGVSQLNGRGTHLRGNFVGCTEPSSAVGGYNYISVSAGSGQTDAQVVVTDNLVRGAAVASGKGIGMALQLLSGGGNTLHARVRNNRIQGVSTVSYLQQPGVTIYEQDAALREHAVTNAATTRFSGAARGTGGPTVGGAGNDFAGTFTFGTGTSPTTGSVGGVTYSTAFASAPVVILTPGNAATAALGLYAGSATTNNSINVSTAPAASQPAGTYVVYYQVIG